MSILNRQRNILEFTLLSLFRRKGRNMALVTVYTLIVALLGSVSFFTASIKHEAANLLEGAPDIVVQRLTAGRQDLIPAAYSDEFQNIRGVSSATGRYWGYYYDEAVGANYTIMARDTGGAVPGPAPGRIIIGPAISRGRGAALGDLFSFRTYAGGTLNLEVQQVMPAASELVAADIILVSSVDFQRLFNMPPGLCTDIALTVKNPREQVTIARKISDRFPDTRPIIRSEILRTYDAVFNWRSGMMLVVLSGAVFAFIIFAWDRASGLSAEEKREIGILKAIGWETSDILYMKFWEGTTVSLTSFLLGTLLAYVHIVFFASILFESALKGWSVLYPSFRLLPYIDIFQVVVLFFLTVIPYTVATLIPSWRAAITDPDSVLRE